jgi:hypothetical protein
MLPLKDFVSTVVSTTGTSNTREAFARATVLLMIPGDQNCWFQTAFVPDGQSTRQHSYQV